MKNFILVHTHRHGTSAYLLQSHRMLGPDDAIAFLGDEFEEDREDEFVDIELVTPETVQ